jgi:integrase
VPASEARQVAENLWHRHRRGEPLDDGPRKGGDTIASTWPRFKARLEDRGKSRRTISAYADIMNRLSDDVKNRPLRELGADPTIMEREVERIRALLNHKKRGGFAMATACARFVSTLFSFAQHRDPTLRGNPCSAVETVDPRRTDLPILRRAEMEDWWEKVQKIPNEVERWALVFCLLSGLRRGSLEKLAWEHLRQPKLKSTRHSNSRAEGRRGKELRLILSRPMLRSCGAYARRAGDNRGCSSRLAFLAGRMRASQYRLPHGATLRTACGPHRVSRASHMFYSVPFVRGCWLRRSSLWHALARCAPVSALSTTASRQGSPSQPTASPQKPMLHGFLPQGSFPICEVQLCANHPLTDPSL